MGTVHNGGSIIIEQFKAESELKFEQFVLFISFESLDEGKSVVDVNKSQPFLLNLLL